MVLPTSSDTYSLNLQHLGHVQCKLQPPCYRHGHNRWYHRLHAHLSVLWDSGHADTSLGSTSSGFKTGEIAAARGMRFTEHSLDVTDLAHGISSGTISAASLCSMQSPSLCHEWCSFPAFFLLNYLTSVKST